MTHCYPRPPMRWNGAIGVIERCKRVSTVCVPKSRSKQELRSICGEKPKAKGVSRPFKPYMKRVQDDSNPVLLLQSRFLCRFCPASFTTLSVKPDVDVGFDPAALCCPCLCASEPRLGCQQFYQRGGLSAVLWTSVSHLYLSHRCRPPNHCHRDRPHRWPDLLLCGDGI